MSDSSVVTICLNVVLCGASGYSLAMIAPGEHPYAFAGCVIGFVHGFVGLMNACMESEGCKSANETTSAIMEIVPLPLINMDLFIHSESPNLAICHGVFIIPLAIDLLLSLVKEADENKDTYETLKILTILGNCLSLLYLAVNENRLLYGFMSLTAFTAKFGAEFIESLAEGAGKHVTLCAYSVFYVLTALALKGGD